MRATTYVFCLGVATQLCMCYSSDEDVDCEASADGQGCVAFVQMQGVKSIRDESEGIWHRHEKDSPILSKAPKTAPHRSGRRRHERHTESGSRAAAALAASEAAVAADKVHHGHYDASTGTFTVHGVTIHNYHRRFHVRDYKNKHKLLKTHMLKAAKGVHVADQFRKDAVTFDWNLVLSKDFKKSDVQALHNQCATLNVECSVTQKLHFAVVHCDEDQIKEIIEKFASKLEEVEPDLVGHEVPDLGNSEDGEAALVSTNITSSSLSKRGPHYDVPESMWNLDVLDGATDLDGKYDALSDAANVNVYVLDSGIRLSHEEFEGRAKAGVDFTQGCGLMDYLFDSCKGVDCGSGCADERGHGTHVAGIVGSRDHGVAKQVTLHNVKVINDEGSTFTSWVVRALDWVSVNAETPAVVQMSLGFSFKSQALENAVDEVVGSGITVVVAAGNENDDACLYTPSDTSAITVAAFGREDERPSFSNYGQCVDIYAPGTGIKSLKHTDDIGTVKKSGTSMAAPHVTGVVAQFLSINPQLTPLEVKRILLQEARVGDVKENMPQTPNKILRLYGDTLPKLLPDAPEPAIEVPSGVFFVDSGDCVVLGNNGSCVTSANYPEKYSNKAYCEISVASRTAIDVIDFETEKKYDKLYVDGVKYHGKTAPEKGIVPTQVITWSSDGSGKKKGWKICANDYDWSSDGSTFVLPPDLVRHTGADCIKQCVSPGYCDWCGTGNACCKIGDRRGNKNAPECATMTQWGSEDKFVCVSQDWPQPNPILNAGVECKADCGGAGLCDDFCGQGNACCRFNSEHDPAECAWMIGFTSTDMHQCVSPEGPNGVPAWFVAPTGSPTNASPPPPPPPPPPTAAPTRSPTNAATSNPTAAPTSSPTDAATSNPTAAPTTSPTEATDEYCWSFCAPRRAPWTVKCKWNDCKDCSDCSAQQVVEPVAEVCLSFCAGRSAPWTKKCKWDECKDCSDCSAQQGPGKGKGKAKITACEPYCARRKASWDKKCTWDECKDCLACSGL